MGKIKKGLIFALAMVITTFGISGCSTNSNKVANNSENIESEISSVKSIETSELEKNYESADWIVVDTRLNDSYNGWILEGEKRGGHIKGAVDFSANWLDVKKDDSENILDEALANKNITKDKNIVLYDANGKDALKVADYLENKGYEKLYTYDVKLWAANEKMPMEKYLNYNTIVPAKVVKDILDGKNVDSFEKDAKIKIVEASWGEEANEYLLGHVPTSIHINTDLIEPPTETEPIMWMLASDDKLEKFALEYGFTKDDTIIVTSKGQIAAYRVALVLKYIGVKDVRILNGGLDAWTSAGYELETTSNKPVAVESFGAKIPLRGEVIDTIDETIEGLKVPEKFTLVDNRTWKEYIGEISGYSYHDKMGRIPGAVFGYAGKTDSYSMDYYRNIDNTMRNAKEIKALWDTSDIDTKTHLSFMCGSGWRAAEIYFYAETMGIKDIGVFSDGWIGWSNTESLPTVVGEPNK